MKTLCSDRHDSNDTQFKLNECTAGKLNLVFFSFGAAAAALALALTSAFAAGAFGNGAAAAFALAAASFADITGFAVSCSNSTSPAVCTFVRTFVGMIPHAHKNGCRCFVYLQLCPWWVRLLFMRDDCQFTQNAILNSREVEWWAARCSR